MPDDREVLGAGFVDGSTFAIAIGPRGALDDGQDDDDGWNTWRRGTHPIEQRLAGDLLDADVGDVLVCQLEGREAEAEIKYKRVDPGVAEIRLEHDMTAWVVKEHWLFITTNDCEQLFMGTWKEHDNVGADWRVVPADRSG